jgi:hypothetical protein
MEDNNRDPRISFPLFSDEKKRMNETILVKDRLQSAVFRQITLELIDLLEQMPPVQQRIFLSAIIDRKLTIKEWHPVLKNLVEKEEKYNETQRP